MTIRELTHLLDTTLNTLQREDIEDHAKLDLQILVFQLKRQLVVASFDPLKDLDSVTIADLSELSNLADEVEKEVANEARRVKLLQQITATAKIALKAAGVPIPS